MPKKPRTEEEVNAVKERILDQALEIIRRDGFEMLTMRRLADMLGVRAVTIYSYFESKDHIYIAVLGQGYRRLHHQCLEAYTSAEDPIEKAKAMAIAYLDFGINSANFYNIMFTWNVPKYQDYVGTPIEEAAMRQTVEALKVYQIFIKVVKEIVSNIREVSEEEAQRYIIYFWTTLHGYITGVNNGLLNYMYDEPLKLREMILENLFKSILQEIREETGRSRKQ